MDHRYLDTPTPLAFAHRGGAAEGDENTTAAFHRAVQLGFRYVETDVHATADGVPVVIHDDRLDRLAGHPGRISDLTWADLRSVRVGGAATVPRLDEVLDAWPQIRFNVDVKSAAVVEPAVAAVHRTAAEDRVLIASFSDTRLARVRALAGPRLATAVGVRGVARLRLASITGRPVRLPESVAAVQIPVRHSGIPILTAQFLEYVRRIGRQLHVWTIDDPEEMHRLLDLGVDGIMTDRVEVLRDVYSARGVWLS